MGGGGACGHAVIACSELPVWDDGHAEISKTIHTQQNDQHAFT